MMVYNEIKSFKSTSNELKKERKQYKPPRDLRKRIMDLEKQTAEQDQYLRTKCVELVGLPQNTSGEDLKVLVVEAFEIAGFKLKKQDFHAIHRLENKKIVIANLVNRRDVLNLLRNKKNYENSVNTTKINSNQQ